MNYQKHQYEDMPPVIAPVNRSGNGQKRVPPTAFVRRTFTANPPQNTRMFADAPAYEEYYEVEDQYSNSSMDKYPQVQQQQQQEPVNSGSRYVLVRHQTLPETPVYMDELEEPIDVKCPDDNIPPSPSYFNEYVPGAWEQIVKERSLLQAKAGTKVKTELDATDVKLVNELGQLSVDNLLDYMKNLQNNSFMLGEEETKEFQRAKFIGMFNKS